MATDPLPTVFTLSAKEPPDAWSTTLKAILEAVPGAVTDTGREVVYDVDNKPGVSNLLTILSATTETAVSELQTTFEGKGYGDLKAAVADAVIELFAPVRKRFAELIADPGYLDEVLAKGAATARPIAAGTMRDVRSRIGLLAPA